MTAVGGEGEAPDAAGVASKRGEAAAVAGIPEVELLHKLTCGGDPPARPWPRR